LLEAHRASAARGEPERERQGEERGEDRERRAHEASSRSVRPAAATGASGAADLSASIGGVTDRRSARRSSVPTAAITTEVRSTQHTIQNSRNGSPSTYACTLLAKGTPNRMPSAGSSASA